MKTFITMTEDFANMNAYETMNDNAAAYIIQYARDNNTTPNAIIEQFKVFLRNYDDKGEPMVLEHMFKRAFVTAALFNARRCYHSMLSLRKAA